MTSAFANDPRVTWDHGAARFTDPADGHTVRVAYDEVFQVTAVVARHKLSWEDMDADAAIRMFLGDPR